MLCERVLGNVRADVARFSSPPRVLDELQINWWELDRRALRRTTAGGQTIRILLPLGQTLTDGDVLFDNQLTLIVLCVVPCEVMVAKPRSMAEMGVISLVVGNLHAPAQIVDREILIAPDGPVEAAFASLNVTFDRQVRRFEPRRCEGMPALQISPNFQVRSGERSLSRQATTDKSKSVEAR